MNVRTRAFLTAAIALAICPAVSKATVVTPTGDLSQAINALIPGSGMNLKLNSVTPFDTATAGNIAELRSDVLESWVYPDATVTGSSISIANVGRIGDQGFSVPELQDHIDLLSAGPLSLQPGDKVFQVSYTLTDPNGVFNFSTLAYEDANGNALFEPFLYMAPVNDDYIGVTQPGKNHDVEFNVEWPVGHASGSGDVSIVCDANGRIVRCDGLTDHEASFLAEASTTKEPPKIFKQNGDECCSVVFHFAFANGFKSIEVGADGFSLKITGALGYSGSKEALVTKCCSATPTPDSSATGGLLGASVIGLAIVRKRFCSGNAA